MALEHDYVMYVVNLERGNRRLQHAPQSDYRHEQGSEWAEGLMGGRAFKPFSKSQKLSRELKL